MSVIFLCTMRTKRGAHYIRQNTVHLHFRSSEEGTIGVRREVAKRCFVKVMICERTLERLLNGNPLKIKLPKHISPPELAWALTPVCICEPCSLYFNFPLPPWPGSKKRSRSPLFSLGLRLASSRQPLGEHFLVWQTEGVLPLCFGGLCREHEPIQ